MIGGPWPGQSPLDPTDPSTLGWGSEGRLASYRPRPLLLGWGTESEDAGGTLGLG